MTTLPHRFPPRDLQVALADSITDGVFVDTVYHVFSTRLSFGKIGKPKIVYASSAILQGASSYFRAQLSGGFLKQEDIPKDTDSYEYDSDSDLDDDEGELEPWSPRLSTIVLNPKETEKETEVEPSLPALPAPTEASGFQMHKYVLAIPDVATVTWHALIFYIYTGKVKFAPLKSQGLELRKEAIAHHNTKDPFGPPMCSPKSMYRLADIVGIDSLKEAALDGIKSELPHARIVNELFSDFTSRYPDVLKAEVEYLYQSPLPSTAVLSIEQKITLALQGKTPHVQNVIMALLSNGSGRFPSPPDVVGEPRPGPVEPCIPLPSRGTSSTKPFGMKKGM